MVMKLSTVGMEQLLILAMENMYSLHRLVQEQKIAKIDLLA
nr:MAG TPA: hypothetical protein [Caudoviricetes sp.]